MSTESDYDRLLEVQSLKRQELQEGDIWYLVSKSWYEGWKDACLGRASKKATSATITGARLFGPVDNSDITETNPQPGKAYDLIIMPPVMEGEHAELIPKSAHDLLEQWCAVTLAPAR